MSPKVFLAEIAAASLLAFLLAPGSTPEANSFFASSRFCRASASDTSGYDPWESFFCFPAKR
jgi:hypothetical protein